MQDVSGEYVEWREKRKKKPGISGKPRDILIVDDDEAVGLGLAELLKDAGFNASYVTCGRECIEEVKKKQYRLIFMDMVMPGINGLDTFRLLRKTEKDPRVVLFTGFFKDAEKLIADGVREGMIDERLRKPFFAEEIINAAKKYL